MARTTSSIDEGWAWAVLFAGCLGNAITCGTSYSTGVINVLFLESFNESRAKTAWVAAINASLVSAGGPLSSLLVSYIGFRWTIIIGGLTSAFGCVLGVFCSGIDQLILTFGVVTGLGCGIAYTAVVTSVGHYFLKYRVMALGISSIGSGIGTFVFAPVIQALADTYDWKGTLLLIGGIQLHLCLCGTLIRPINHMNTSKDWQNDEKRNNKEGKSCINPFKLLKNGKLMLTAFSVLFATLGQFIVYVHLSAYALSSGSSHNEAALLLSIVGVTSVIARFFFASSATDIRIGALLMYSGSLGLNGLLLLATPFLMPHYWGQIIVASLFGFYGNGWYALIPQLTIEYVGLPLLTTAFGYEMFMAGLGSLLGPPFAGWIYDVTKSYEYAFYLAGVMIIVSSLLMMATSMLATTSGEHEGEATDVIIVKPTEEKVDYESNLTTSI